jgi:hypothetical protein
MAMKTFTAAAIALLLEDGLCHPKRWHFTSRKQTGCCHSMTKVKAVLLLEERSGKVAAAMVVVVYSVVVGHGVIMVVVLEVVGPSAITAEVLLSTEAAVAVMVCYPHGSTTGGICGKL